MGNPLDEEEIMKCYECGGEMIEKVTSVEMKKEDGSFVIFSDVKVNECRQCGEIYLPAESAEKVGKIMRGEEEKQPKTYITVPVYAVHY